MANAKPPDPLDVMEHLLNDVLVQTGKALKANSKNGKKTAALSNMSRIYEVNEKFNSALDDLEYEIIRAKSVLRRDLEALQAKRKPPQPPEPQQQGPAQVPQQQGPAQVPQAPPAPMMIDSESPTLPARPAPPPQARPVKAESKQVAPFPDMGGDTAAPVVPSPPPQLGIKNSPESRSPQPAAAKLPAAAAAAAPAGVQSSSAGLKPTPTMASLPAAAAATTARATSPAVKTGPSPAVKTGSPAVVIKTGSSPANTSPPAPKPAAVKAAASPPQQPPAPAPAPAPAPTVPLPAAPDAMDNFFDLTGSPGPQSTSPELNFTDMQFSLAVASDEAETPNPHAQTNMQQQQQQESHGANIDFTMDDAFTAPGGGLAPTSSDQGRQAATAPGPAPAPVAEMDDLFNLGGTSMDMDLNLVGGEGVDSSTNFDDLFLDTGDAEMEELDTSFL